MNNESQSSHQGIIDRKLKLVKAPLPPEIPAHSRIGKSKQSNTGNENSEALVEFSDSRMLGRLQLHYILCSSAAKPANLDAKQLGSISPISDFENSDLRLRLPFSISYLGVRNRSLGSGPGAGLAMSNSTMLLGIHTRLLGLKGALRV